jgi:hypothetical protein
MVCTKYRPFPIIESGQLDRTKPRESALIAPVDPVTPPGADLDKEGLERLSR